MNTIFSIGLYMYVQFRPYNVKIQEGYQHENDTDMSNRVSSKAKCQKEKKFLTYFYINKRENLISLL